MELQILLITAVSIAFIHTLIGPDHYLPFIVMAKARGWRIGKTLGITFWCGVGHVLGSVVLGIAGVALGVAVQSLEILEGYRGDLASWLLIGFGIAYGVWGVRLAWRRKEHVHPHDHEDDHHHHKHHHLGSHAHLHGDEQSITPWALFVVFVLGPCEPLIPILMYPAARGGWMDLLWVTLAFGAVTIATMMAIVFVMVKGLARIDLGFMERYIHALAGFIIAVSGLAIKLFGL